MTFLLVFLCFFSVGVTRTKTLAIRWFLENVQGRFCLGIGVVFVGVVSSCYAAGTALYPYSYTVEQHYIGMQLYPPADTGKTAYFSVRRQPFWAGAGTIVSVLSRGGRVHRSATLAGAELVCGTRLADNALALVVSQNNALQCVVFDTALTAAYTVVLPQDYVAPRYLHSVMLALSPQRFFFTVNGVLFAGVIGSRGVGLVPLAHNIADIAVSAEKERLVYATHTAGGTDVVFCDSMGAAQVTITMQTQEDIRLQVLDKNAVAVIEELDASSAVTIVENNGAVTKVLVPSFYQMVSVRRRDSRAYTVTWVRDTREGSEALHGVIQRNGTDMRLVGTVALPDYLFDAVCLRRIGAREYCIFRSGMATLDQNGGLVSAERLPLYAEQQALPTVVPTADGIAVVYPSGSLLLMRKANSLWWLNRIIDNSLWYVLVLFALIIIVLLWKVAYRQRRLLRTLFEAPEAEPMLIMDPEGRLLQLNDSARALFRIPPDVPMGRMLHSYLVGVMGLQELAQEVLAQRQRSSQRVEVSLSGGDGDEYVFTATPVLSMFRHMRWIFITGRNITRELERKRVANWAQLAHDMQTNLSIIRLNAEKIIATADDSPVERGKKILLQANLLINRVRDLVTIGRQDTLNMEQVNVLEMCTAVCQEFDPTFFPHVVFHIEAPMVIISCDRAKLERALRNAVENAIRALQGNDGTVELSSWFDDTAVYFQVKDSGVGMDKQTKENMMKPFFTTFGKQGGTGMGTVIMRHVIQMHGGELFVESEKGRGTSVVFRLPHRNNVVRHVVGNDAVEVDGGGKK